MLSRQRSSCSSATLFLCASACVSPSAEPESAVLGAAGVSLRLDATGVATPGWRFELDSAPANPHRLGNRVEYDRPGGITEWYEARPSGVEQGFTVANRPVGDLVVSGRVDTRDAVRALPDGLAFGDLRYTSLRAWDAVGRELPATMEWDAPARTLRLRVPGSALATAEFPVVVDPLLSMESWTGESDQDGAEYGYSVASAGDVNGDGYADVVVGARFYEDGFETNEGRVSLYLGSPTGLSTTADWTAEPDVGLARLGMSVAGAGDVNGDGYADVIVGAPYWYDMEVGEGAAFLYFGSPSGLSLVPDWSVQADQMDANFGISVASAGDVDGDGFADVLVGAWNWTNPEAEEGAAFLYLGSSTGPSTAADWSVESNQAMSRYGFSVASAGDVDGDGFSDVIVGAYGWDNPDSSEGRAFLYLGSAAGLATMSAWDDESDQMDARFGFAASSAGDVDGDGFADVLVSSQLHDNGNTDEGGTFLYLGSSGGLATTPSWSAEGGQDGAEFGYSTAGVGDVNGDGYADVVVGARYWDGGQMNEGRAALYLGSSTGLQAAPQWSPEGDQDGAEFGFSVAGAGDVDGDGFGDVVVGARLHDSPEPGEGRAYLYRGYAVGPALVANWTAEPNQASAALGVSVAAAGDVNGDGFDDLLAGAHLYDNGETDEGRAFLYEGSATGPSPAASWTAESDQMSARLGLAVSSAGDVDADGFADVIVGAPYFGNGEFEEGRAYMFLGSAGGLSLVADWSAESDQISAYMGQSLASAGDVNGDGFSDLLIGIPGFANGEAGEGAAFVFLGSAAGPSLAPDWTAESDQVAVRLGASVASAGDVNGDGFADVLIGAPDYANGESQEGRAYVFFGSGTGPTITPDWSAESDQLGAQFGYAVASAGDVDGDGFADILVGAPLFDNGQTDEGRAYGFSGSATGPSLVADWVAEPDQAISGFGNSVASAGDVNGDGFSDVIVGAAGHDNGQADEGVAFVYLGSASGPAASPAFTLESDQAAAAFGAVATAGDVNGDGFGDIAVGASSFDNVEADEGRAFVYLGGDGAPALARELRQFQADGVTRIGVGAAATSNTVVFEGRVTQEGSKGGRLRLEVEVKPSFVAFDAQGTVLSSPAIEGTVALVTVAGISGGPKHWRARVVYPVGTGWGRWVSFGGNGETDPDLRVFAPNGTACAGSSGCLSGICEDGVCCAVACGLCSSCDVMGTTCSIIPADDPDCAVVSCGGLDTVCRDFADVGADRCEAAADCHDADDPAICTESTDLAGDCGVCGSCAGGVCTADLSQNADCGPCQECASVGTCGPQASGTDVKDDCAPGECETGSCDGTGACGQLADDTACSDDGDPCTEDSCQGGTCVHAVDPLLCPPEPTIDMGGDASDAAVDEDGSGAGGEVVVDMGADSEARTSGDSGCGCAVGGDAEHGTWPPLVALGLLAMLRRRARRAFVAAGMFGLVLAHPMSVAAQSCGDLFCAGTENRCNCPTDCAATCGDGCCLVVLGPMETDHESCGNCPADCSPCPDIQTCTQPFPPPIGVICSGCGNDFDMDGMACDFGESACNCPQDCPPACGDGCCLAPEDAQDCNVANDPPGTATQGDCLSVCPDGFCTAGETMATCPADCTNCNVNGVCNAPPGGAETECNCTDCGLGTSSCGDMCCGSSESFVICPLDCPSICGDSFCNATNENCATCPGDCLCPAGQTCEVTGTCSGCGDMQCNSVIGENCANCAADCSCMMPLTCQAQTCVGCGDGSCSGAEDCANCAMDCGCAAGIACLPPCEGCGNGVCSAPSGETCGSCETDCACPAGQFCVMDECTQCGNSVCDAGENCTLCQVDCGCPAGQDCVAGTCSGCGNGTCDDLGGEGCATCPQDCLPCPLGTVCSGAADSCTACGNGSCEPAQGESCQACALDCPCLPPATCQFGVCIGAPTCPDGVCDSGENRCTCPQDCVIDICGEFPACCSGSEDSCTCVADCPGFCCGNGLCEPGEDASNCPTDCPCGDGLCDDTIGESSCSCIFDCPAACDDDCCNSDEDQCSCQIDCPGDCCGDGICGTSLPETNCNCAADCAVICGDGCCSGGEDPCSCPSDGCPDSCGDGCCTGSETSASCGADCVCDTDAVCEPLDGETPCSCTDCPPMAAVDGCCSGAAGEIACTEPACPPDCGDACCSVGETRCTCAVECATDVCGDGCCTGAENACDPGCGGECTSFCGDGCCTGSECPANCPMDCTVDVCGDGCCTGAEVACDTGCASECPPFCGDGCCSGTETPCSCAVECTIDVCGDGCCGDSETECTCAIDCVPVCGDGCCDAATENCALCETDCACLGTEVCVSGLCATCGNGSCEAGLGETCGTCVADCACASPATCVAGECVGPPDMGVEPPGAEPQPDAQVVDRDAGHDMVAVTPEPDGGADEGCACRVGHGPAERPDRMGWLALALALAVGVRRRRARRNSPPTPPSSSSRGAGPT